ncbi:hypothetical protein T11_13965 [Trichinella zimbabwensis]|uniref:Uncharacterized protein n=1 Tax=Trichinella zimbabwensis TaxID=268475 RepID=A0A0V1E933_9BILA|nr:hypothetical protein T11_13965 [Trichinella zimbabwensis]
MTHRKFKFKLWWIIAVVLRHRFLRHLSIVLL